jgi:hypothetical protein
MKYIIISNRKQLEFEVEKMLNSKLPINLYYEEIKSYKTKEQLGFFWGGIIQDLLKYFNDIGQTIENEDGVIRKWDSEDVKLWLYYNILGLNYKILPSGDIVPYSKTIRDMSKQEMSSFISDCFNLIDNETDCILRPWVRTCWLNHIDDKYWTLLDTVKFMQEDKDYLRHQLKQSCLYCGDRKNIVYHHIKSNKYSGASIKSPDWFTITLCHNCHTILHNHGQDEIIKGLQLYKFEVEVFCKLNYIKWLYKL